VLGVTLTAGLARAAGVTNSPAPMRASLGASRTLLPGYFGINYDYGGASVYVGDANVAQQLAALGPGTLRWPAGTGANYFQWQKGYPVNPGGTGGGSCAAPKESETDGFRFTLADLAAAYRRSGATPIFDLNVMTATLASQIAMLKTARHQYGLPVKYVELGNEFYLCTTDFVTAFPTAQDYGKTVAADVKALHQAFPGVRIAAVGALPGKSARTQGWNAGLLSVASGAGKPDAITLHDHPQFNQSLTTVGLPALFAEPYTSASSVAAATKEFPGTPAWITEYGLSLHWTKGNAPQLTYANALFESEAALLLAQKVSAATLVNYWSSFGPAVNYAYTKAGLSTVGLAMEWLDQAVRGATAEAAINFPGGPVLGSTGYPALVGELFRMAGSHRAMLINLNGHTVTIGASAAIPSGARYRQVSGSPTRQYATASGLSSTSGIVGRTIKLAPYSMTLLAG
jgi:hypothetical protein